MRQHNTEYPLDQSGFKGQHYASAGTQCAWEGWQGAWEEQQIVIDDMNKDWS